MINIKSIVVFWWSVYMSKEGYSYKDVELHGEGLEIPEERKFGDHLGFEPSTFCILDRCSYHGVCMHCQNMCADIYIATWIVLHNISFYSKCYIDPGRLRVMNLDQNYELSG